MKTLRVLLIEDSNTDAERQVANLEAAGYAVYSARANTADALRDALAEGIWDVVLADYRLRDFSSLEALEILHEDEHDIPFIIISGSIGEEAAASLMRHGIDDYLMKDNLTRLAPAVAREIQEAENRRVKREAEKALEESEERLQMALSAAGMGAWEWDLLTDDIFWSPECSAILGIPIGGAQASDIQQLILEEDREFRAEKIRLAVARRSSFTVRFRAKRRDGEIIWIAESGKCEFDTKGVPIRIVGTMRDITRDKKAEDALIEAEERYRTVVETAADAVMSIDEDSTIIFANRAAESIFGYSQAELLGQSISIIQPEGRHAAHHAGLTTYLTTGERKLDWRSVETQARKKDGTLIDVQISFGVFRKGTRQIFTAFIRDITERKRSENAIKRSEREFRALVEATTQFVWQLDERGKPLHFPDWWVELTGQNFEESRNYGWLEYVHPDDRARVRNKYESALESGTPVILELRIRDIAGKFRYYTARGIPLFSDDGKSRRWICALAEITAQRKAEENLKDSEERYRLISSISSDYMYSTDVDDAGELGPDWIVGAFERITGYTREEFIAHGGWRSIIHPDDVEKDIEDFETLRRNEPVISELRIISKSGQTVWIRSYAQPIWSVNEKKLVGICGAVQDITERKTAEESLRESETRLRTILNAEPECVKVLSLNGEILEMNPAGLAIVQAESVDKVLGATARDLLLPEHLKNFQDALEAVRAGREAEVTYEITGLKGRRRWLDMMAVPMRDARGEINSILAVSRDITEKRIAETELRRQAMLIDQSSEAIFMWDLDTGIQMWNTGCERLYGFTREEVLGRFGYELLRSEFPIPRDQVLAAIREAGLWSGEVVQTTKTGRKVFADSRYQLIAFDGRKVVLQTNRDITARITAERALRQSETRYKDLFESNPYPMWVYDVETLRFLAVNDAAIHRYGYSKGEFLSMSILDIRPPEDAGKVREKARETTLSIDTSGNWRHKKKNGELIKVEITSHSLEFEGRKARLVLANDVTERLLAEEALRHSEEKYRELIENANDLIYTHDLDGRFTSLNRAGERMTGYTEEEVLKMNVADFLTPEEMKAAKRLMIDTGNDDKPELFEMQLRSKDGRIVFLEINIRLVRHEGKPVGIQGIGRDITERKLAEEEIRRHRQRLEKTTEAAPAAIYAFCMRPDGTQNFPWSSPAVERIYGFTPEQLEESGDAVFEHMHPDDVGWIRETVLGATRDLSPIHVTFRYNHPAGHETWIEGWASVTKEKDGSFIFHSIATDVTDQVEAREALRETQQQLQQAQKLESIGILAGGMAHDFNNMLTAINGYSDLILRKLKTDDPIRRNIEEIRKAGERSTELTRQLLAFSRRQIMLPKVLDVNEVIVETSTMLRRLIGENIHVSTRLDPDLGSVEADPGQLSQILVNFVINSRDAMPNGGSIVIETANVELDENYASRHVSAEPGDYVMLAVSDTGIGMDEETRQRIFEPFFTTKEVGRGTGLGLSTVYGIVKQSGGNIWVYSEPGKGTTFKIYLPRVNKPNAAKNDAALRNSMRGTETILLVEDEDAVRNLSREILETCGYTVFEASNGGEALELAKLSKLRFDLLVTDIVMPVLGGRELAEILTKTRPSLKVLFTSGYTDDAILRHGIIDEGTNFLQKPFTFESLSRMVRGLLDS